MPASRCTKARYRTNLDAKIALAKVGARRDNSHEESRTYYCDECKAYHLSSKPKRRR